MENKNFFDVYDIEGKLVLVNATAKEVEAEIGLQARNVKRYATTGSLYKYKHKIVEVERTEQVEISEYKRSQLGDLLREWDRTIYRKRA